MILLISGLILYLLKSLDLLYLFQIKEYRLDRILSFLKEENVFKILYLRAIRMPAISLRNLLIGQAMLFSTVPLYLILKTSNLALLSAFLLLTPIVALLTMLLGLLLSEIPVQIYRKLIIFIAALKVKNSNAVFIGITGSYGKTSTKEFLFQILSHKYKVGKTEKNYNSEIGVALSILKNLKSDTEYFIAELGAYKKGEIKTICGIIHPKYGILTAIGNQHLNLFGSKKNLIEAKSELLEVLPPDGVAFINKNIREWKYFSNKTKAEKEYFSIDEIPPDIKTNLPGRHNLQNLLPCIALASHLGLDRSVILETIMNLKPIQDRLTQKKGPNESMVLDDSYSSNVEGFIAAINAAGQINSTHKLIISRGLIELGEEKKTSYQKIVDEINKSNLTLLTTDALFKKLDTRNKVVAFQNEGKLLNYVKEKSDKNTLIVIEGRFEPKILKSLISNFDV
ncbi:hypothetical protein A3A46_00030 [Candidatus Roizmanbacteria bacterium RIFCSPLOWO2_01_FULL_37_13]|uniref:Mur ligase central domain-containing protein n=1 Tax=Candidatus Roizmanbacteria bacterium RIFCSPHIGHO2_02_FULL_38_11 TaxID=1802039 RepID=A0A1F7H1Q6_9BACT|nr:MAG: hypothetical protein A3C25_04605 [Candidatus Roizmanbacteria bacterium RIFCSPHIGHO2_02_FULL_38_11]OGK42932.1 MAG: hypothetical protein A3A46_00030 [Candidatus Roizmanbacteria bacterium RIFCSPLOWO2_01_FULL_37_13]